jgi:DNA-directed RNA polymerase subunit omega
METIPSRYLLVNVTARRAREIAETAERQEIHLDEKPVKLAINEIASGTLVGRVKSEYQYKLD